MVEELKVHIIDGVAGEDPRDTPPPKKEPEQKK